MPLMRDVIVGFFGFRPSPFVAGPFAVGFEEGGREKCPSGCECTEEAVEAEAAGEGFTTATAGLLGAGAAMVVALVGSGSSGKGV
jgi:hypothetical protein